MGLVITAEAWGREGLLRVWKRFQWDGWYWGNPGPWAEQAWKLLRCTGICPGVSLQAAASPMPWVGMGWVWVPGPG